MLVDVELGEVWSGMVMWAVKCSGVLSWKIESLDLLGSLKIRGGLQNKWSVNGALLVVDS